MKANKSPLILNDFLLLRSNYHFNRANADPKLDIFKTMVQYPIDIDFNIRKVNENLFQLLTKIEINQGAKPLPGYILFIEGASLFSFNKEEKLSEEEKANLLHYSGLNITINSLRNIMATLTANGPFNKYTLPTIDVSKLLQDKQNQLENTKE